MAKVTPDEFHEKWSRRLKGAQTDIRKGIERTTTSPTEKAAQKGDKMLAGVEQSIRNGKWQAGLRRVTLEDWKDAAINKGLGRISAGVDGAQKKVTDFASQLLPHIDRGVEKVKNMPDLTIEDSINRSATFIRHMADFKRSR